MIYKTHLHWSPSLDSTMMKPCHYGKFWLLQISFVQCIIHHFFSNPQFWLKCFHAPKLTNGFWIQYLSYKSLVGPFKHFNRKHLASVRSFRMRVCQNVWQSDHLLLFQPIKKQLCWSIILWLVEVVVGAQKFICQLKNAIKLFSTVMPEGEKIWGRRGGVQ